MPRHSWHSAETQHKALAATTRVPSDSPALCRPARAEGRTRAFARGARRGRGRGRGLRVPCGSAVGTRYGRLLGFSPAGYTPPLAAGSKDVNAVTGAAASAAAAAAHSSGRSRRLTILSPLVLLFRAVWGRAVPPGAQGGTRNAALPRPTEGCNAAARYRSHAPGGAREWHMRPPGTRRCLCRRLLNLHA